VKLQVLDSFAISASGSTLSGPISLAAFSSSFSMFYTISGTGIADIFLYVTHDGSNYVKITRALKRGATAGTDMVHIPVPPCDAFKIGVEEVGAANSVTVTIDIVFRPGQFGDIPLYDGSTSAMMTIDYAHHEAHAGSHFFVVGYQDLSINNVLDFTWLMPNTTKWSHWTWNIETESETLWQVYENVAVVNALANAITPLNSNRNSGTTSVTTMKYEVQANLAAANGDTNVSGGTLIESGISGAGKNGGDSQRENEIIMKQNTLYCLRATATAAGFINFKMYWYEHTNR
jgi:hypothetical protein